VLGGSAASIGFEDGTTPFARQSHFQVRGSQLLVMDGGEAGDGLRVLEYTLDLEAATATEAWSLVAGETGVSEPLLGSVTRIDDAGTTLVNWAAVGRIELLLPGEASTWSVEAESGHTFGFHTLATNLYAP
jgi:hypothetical protein